MLRSSLSYSGFHLSPPNVGSNCLVLLMSLFGQREQLLSFRLVVLRFAEAAAADGDVIASFVEDIAELRIARGLQGEFAPAPDVLCRCRVPPPLMAGT